MTAADKTATILCKSCGLCCTGHLFVWVRLNAAELSPCQSIGLNVIRDDPRQRGFTQPCPLWRGLCAVYASPHYPRACRSYRCKLLKEVFDENISLSEALAVVRQSKKIIEELVETQNFTSLLVSPNVNFRERLVAQMERGNIELKFRLKAEELLAFYEERFGVNDLFDDVKEE